MVIPQAEFNFFFHWVFYSYREKFVQFLVCYQVFGLSLLFPKKSMEFSQSLHVADQRPLSTNLFH